MIHRCDLGPESAPQGTRTRRGDLAPFRGPHAGGLPGGHWTAERDSTRFRRSLRLIYYEGCPEAADAYRRERYLKTGNDKRYLRQRLKAWRTQFSREKLERDEKGAF
jgi:hypothetical protein